MNEMKIGGRCPLLVNKHYLTKYQLNHSEAEDLYADKQCRLRNLPKVSVSIVFTRIEPEPSAWKAICSYPLHH